MALAFLGLGTNLGDRASNLARAIRMLDETPAIAVRASSSVAETDPVDFTDQPRFLNQVVKIETDLSPDELLAAAKKIEAAMGRTPSVPKGPRLIDIDILLYGDLVRNDPHLTIPHPAILRRTFVIRHLVELEPDIADPVSRRPYRLFLPEE